MIRAALLDRAGFVHGFSTRDGGVSEGPYASLNLGRATADEPARVEENHLRLAALAGLRRAPFTVSQVHGEAIVTVGEGGPPAGAEADALIAREPGVAVGVKTADCVPILLADPGTGAVAAVHAGWRGTKLGIAGKAVRALAAGGATPERLLAAIGPCIHRCCFEVSEELAAAFVADFGAGIAAGRNVDLVAANRSVLLAAGVRPERLELVAGCTSCDRARFYSHRRDAGTTGRHVSYLVAGGAEPGSRSLS